MSLRPTRTGVPRAMRLPAASRSWTSPPFDGRVVEREAGGGAEGDLEVPEGVDDVAPDGPAGQGLDGLGCRARPGDGAHDVGGGARDAEGVDEGEAVGGLRPELSTMVVRCTVISTTPGRKSPFSRKRKVVPPSQTGAPVTTTPAPPKPPTEMAPVPIEPRFSVEPADGTNVTST